MAYTTINDPSAHFHIELYTGNASTQSITNGANAGDFQPDWVWIKSRTHSSYHNIFDSSRGATKRIFSNDAGAEQTTTASLTSFDSDGFSLGNNNDVNANTESLVAWQWKANGGSTTTNDASSTGVGTIDSVIQANTTAGFSIVTHTGTGSSGTIAHGLGAKPDWVLTKNRTDDSTDWANYHVGLSSAEYYVELNTTDAQAAGSSVWGDTAPTSTVFTVGGANTKNNASGKNYVSYCFAPIQGYSKFGSYKGNGESSGAFHYTGFKPAWLMIKRQDSSTNGDWAIYDNERSNIGNGDNENNDFLRANDTAVEASASGLDILSNGFKIRSTSSRVNANDSVYIYIAFADNPFVSSKGVPTTAK